MAKERAKVVMAIITVGSVDDAHAFYTDKLGFRESGSRTRPKA
jgi:catechol 2,3-dioxygenase-like lactoylglutathione lyase family enzyme